MPSHNWLHYRLTTLLIAVMFVAVGVLLCTFLVAPDINQVAVDNGHVTLYLNDEGEGHKTGEAAVPSLLEDPVDGPTPYTIEVIHHDTYIAIPFQNVAIAALLLMVIVAGIYIAMRALLRGVSDKNVCC